MKSQELTKEVLAEMFNGTAGFAGVYQGTTFLGSYPDLRKKVLDKEKKSSDRQTSAKKMLEKLQKSFSDSDIEVFMNKSQPNIVLRSAKIYVIAGPKKLHQLSITHKVFTYDEMERQLPYNGTSGSHDKHILLSGLEFEDIIKVVNLFKMVDHYE